MTLALYGRASEARGLLPSSQTEVRRLRAPHARDPVLTSDVALARSSNDLEAARESGFNAVLVINDSPIEAPGANVLPQLIRLPSQFSYLADGDVVAIHPTTLRFRTLYRRNSKHNSLLVTERCNHYCLMCSQPPKDVDDRWILSEIKRCIPLIDKQTGSLGFTGGEPLLDWVDLIEILTLCRDHLPQTAIHVLSNGRAFCNSEVTEAWAAVRHHDLMVGIPIYSAVDHIHDYVVQAEGAFHETLLGILRLKDKGQRVEVRVVLHAVTAPRVREICLWLARNLPFVDHVALMGLENTGFAIANDKLLWIDPADYASDLASGVDVLVAAGVRVSVYNLPRCILPRSIWPFAVQSISDWKNGFVEECGSCIERDNCSGFFTSGRPRYSRGIKPILPDLQPR